MKKTILKVLTLVVITVLGINYTLHDSLQDMSYPASENAYHAQPKEPAHPLATAGNPAKVKTSQL
jgi:hypothetical protein